jgi:hypothetical protein
MMDVGSIKTTTQIITTLLILVIHSVRVRLEVALEPCRSCLLLASALVQVILLTEVSST